VQYWPACFVSGADPAAFRRTVSKVSCVSVVKSNQAQAFLPRKRHDRYLETSGANIGTSFALEKQATGASRRANYIR
jgi:hypothetical protein